MNRTLDIEMLRTFAVLAETESFTGTGAQLHRTQSTVSAHVKKLEAVLDKVLVERHSKYFRLTSEGERLRGYAQDLLKVHDEAVVALRSAPLQGRIGVGLPEDFAAQQLPVVLGRFTQLYPSIELDVRCAIASDLLASLRDGEIDVALARRRANATGADVLFREPLLWCAATNYRLKRDMPIPLILFPQTCFYRAHMLRGIQRAGLTCRVVYTGSTLASVKAAVAAGVGVSVLPRSAMSLSFRTFGAKDGLPPMPDSEIAFHFRTKTQSAEMKALVEFLRASVAIDLLTRSDGRGPSPPRSGPSRLRIAA